MEKRQAAAAVPLRFFPGSRESFLKNQTSRQQYPSFAASDHRSTGERSSKSQREAALFRWKPLIPLCGRRKTRF
ncbi:hypothetical protein D8N35_00890 [Enterococcus casseliflavus]|nr:hypothetical protein D8N35_00890 [Enterococcus casseliflavus]EEV29877.1 predicted protein [Enterococcus casseliflavus EC30]EEV35578.1 predicted protein [Enterococcus casseliflavus EC10]